MRIAHIVLLVVLVLFLALSIILAEVAFRSERTLLSYGYTYRELQIILEPLDDPDVHDRTISEAFRFVRKSLSFSVPRELEPYILSSAVDGFSASWVGQTLGLWLVTVQQVLHGKRETIELPLSLSPFKNAFLASVRGQFSMQEQLEINQGVDEIPSTFDVADEMPDSLKRRLLSIGRSMDFAQVMLQYLIPGLFIIACFFHRRIGTGLTATGVAFLLSGIPSLIVVYLRVEGIVASVARKVVRSLPDFLSWLGPGLEHAIRGVIVSGRLTAVLVTVYGVLATAGGLYLIIRKNDPRIHLGSG